MEHLTSTLELAPEKIRRKLLDSVVEIITDYVRETFKVADMIPHLVSDDKKRNGIVKGEPPSVLLASKDTDTSSTASSKPNGRDSGGPKSPTSQWKAAPAMSNMSNMSLFQPFTNLATLDLRVSSCESLKAAKLAEAEAEAEVDVAGRRHGTEFDASQSQDSVDLDNDVDFDDPDARREILLREILRHSYSTLFGIGLDEVISSQGLLDNLLDIAHDFADQLTSSVQLTPSQQANLALEPGNGGVQGSSSQGAASGCQNPGRQSNALPGGKAADTPQLRQLQAAVHRVEVQAARRRLPCPFRMKDPFTFNVRDYYSCSMSFFRDIRSLR